MTVVAEFTVPPEALPGCGALVELSHLTVELERIVPTDGGAVPFFWVLGGDPEAFVEHASEHEDVETFQILERIDGAALLQATWRADSPVIRGLEELEATVMHATGTADGWRFRVRSETRECLDEFRSVFVDQGHGVHLERIFDLAEQVGTKRPLTDEQQETLLTAYRRGYFDQPRGVTQADLAEEFGVSSRAISNRLRRGTRNLVGSTLVGTGETDGPDG